MQSMYEDSHQSNGNQTSNMDAETPTRINTFTIDDNWYDFLFQPILMNVSYT